MKKFVLSLGLTLMLLSWGWPQYPRFGVSPAQGQPPPPPYYYNQPYYCDPNFYDQCYSAPYVDPNAENYFYYLVPQIGGELEEHREREHERREYYEHREHEEHEHGRR